MAPSEELTERNRQLEASNAELSAALKWLHSTLECTADGILVVDANGHVINWNGKFLEMWRIPAEMVHDRDDVKLIEYVLSQLKDPEAFVAKVRELYQDQQTCSLDILEFSDGRAFERYSQPHRAETGGGRVWSFRDITERRQAAVALEKAKDAAEAANRAKSQFLANMSHEIRTPMTAILGFAELLRNADAAAEKRQDWVSTIQRNGTHLLTVINDILDISKIDAGQMTIERVSFQFQPIVDELVEAMRQRATAKNLWLTVHQDQSVPDVLHTDPTRFRQILFNLLSNAIKFTESGGVEVTVHSGAQSSEMLYIEVKDTGIGLSEAQISRLFKPFSQADASTTRKFGGTGLGLAISKNLAQMLGGDVTVASHPGRGSTFTVSLNVAIPEGAGEPVEISSTTADSSELSEAHPLAGLSVLLAEDGEDNRELIKLNLTNAGAQVTLVPDGMAACDAALAAWQSKEPFDVILMDMQMPRMDGYQATSHLRDCGYTSPIVALTAHVMSGDREKCVASGCDDFLGKPIDPPLLLRTVAKWAKNPAGELPKRRSA